MDRQRRTQLREGAERRPGKATGRQGSHQHAAGIDRPIVAHRRLGLQRPQRLSTIVARHQTKGEGAIGRRHPQPFPIEAMHQPRGGRHARRRRHHPQAVDITPCALRVMATAAGVP
ncbi:hypothetical protein FYK38_29190, partial [Serratia marcescens]